MYRNRFIIVIVLSILLLAGCQTGTGIEQLRRYNTSGSTDPYQDDYDILDRGPVPGGTLHLFTTEPDSLNPLLTKNKYAVDFLQFIYEGLTRLDSEQKAVPVLADSWSVSSDGLLWTFHIRDGVKWHDGEPLTAYDVEFTIQTILNPGIQSIYKPLLLNIATCAAVDSNSIRMVLIKPNSFLPEMMTFPILARHQFRQKDVLTASKQFRPVGTGPYRFVQYTENKMVEMNLNKDWWYVKAEGNTSSDGMFIETIQANIFKYAEDAMGAFQTGENDVTPIRSGEFSRYRGRTDLSMKKYTSRDFEYLTFNMRNPILADPFLRKAIALAVDREALIRDVLPGDAEPAELPILPSSWISNLDGVPYYGPVPFPATEYTSHAAIQNNPDASVTPEFSVTGPAISMDDEGMAIAANADEAPADSAVQAATPLEALLEGGWKESKQGYYKMFSGARRYLKLELLVNSNNSTRIRAAQKVCEQLQEAGIPAEVKIVEWNELVNRLYSSKYDMAFIGCRIPQIPDLSYLYSGSYLPSTLGGNGENAFNSAGYFNSQLDENINVLFRENDPEKKKIIYKAMRDIIRRDTPYVGLYFLRDAMVYSKNIRGRLNPDTWNRYTDMTQWYKPVSP